MSNVNAATAVQSEEEKEPISSSKPSRELFEGNVCRRVASYRATSSMALRRLGRSYENRLKSNDEDDDDDGRLLRDISRFSLKKIKKKFSLISSFLFFFLFLLPFLISHSYTRIRARSKTSCVELLFVVYAHGMHTYTYLYLRIRLNTCS